MVWPTCDLKKDITETELFQRPFHGWACLCFEPTTWRSGKQRLVLHEGSTWACRCRCLVLWSEGCWKVSSNVEMKCFFPGVFSLKDVFSVWKKKPYQICIRVKKLQHVQAADYPEGLWRIKSIGLSEVWYERTEGQFSPRSSDRPVSRLQSVSPFVEREPSEPPKPTLRPNLVRRRSTDAPKETPKAESQSPDRVKRSFPRRTSTGTALKAPMQRQNARSASPIRSLSSAPECTRAARVAEKARSID